MWRDFFVDVVFVFASCGEERGCCFHDNLVIH